MDVAMNCMADNQLYGQQSFNHSFMVMDNGTSIRRAAHETQFVDICCSAHKLHLFVQDGPTS